MHGNLLLGEISKNRERWHELHKGCIGSGAIPAVAGLSPYQSPLELWCQMKGRSEVSETTQSFFDIGNALEPVVAKIFKQKVVCEVGVCDALFCHPTYSFAICTPDFFVFTAEGDGVMECKSATIRSRHFWQDDNIPDSAHVQLVWQLGIMGYDFGYVAGLIGGDPREFYYKRVDFDPELFDMLIEKAGDFLAMVRSDTQPQAGAGDRGRVLERMQSRKDIPVVNIRTVREWCDDITRIKKELKPYSEAVSSLRSELKEVQNNLAMAVGDGNTIRLEDGRIVSVNIKKTKEKFVPPSTKLECRIR